MSYSEYDVKRIAELREWLDNIIKEKELELDNLKYTLSLIDNLLKTSSFKPAAILTEEQEPEMRQLKSKDDKLLANAYITKDTITIVPISDLKLSKKIPPFQSFFINRILEGMRSKDEERTKRGEISKNEILEYRVDEDDYIKSIVIKNYRDKARLTEILNACEWVLSRMVEKIR
ncbi:MAG: hypothetical protein D6752_03750 [Candidatus Nitrosothermus koennekii]|nr:MAG: hypothetical protein D6752_03750 [Candidatus Nitrosothermus koennekii]